jgi:hypothetical protein
MENKKNKFSWKAFISIGLFYSFIIIFLTGIVLYLAPAGRVSNWINWKLLGITKERWQAIHTIFAFSFAILSIFHLFTINWKAFWSYLKSRTSEGLNKKREFYIMSVLTILILIGIGYSVPPFSSIMDFGGYLKESWESTETAPPIPHAELLTLNELSTKLDSISIEKITNKLNANKIKFDGPNETLSDIGLKNNMPPIEIYNIITKKGPVGKVGSGIGRKSLKEFAKENNLDIEKVMKILKEKDIKASEEQTLKDIANQNNMAPKDIFELIKDN